MTPDKRAEQTQETAMSRLGEWGRFLCYRRMLIAMYYRKGRTI